ncbi:MAG TPA: hypothetical protein VKA95_10185 [Nitrososphaeraceae archaeon]|nr:hypothetical protein [Nitrososphaeraceae archaeon]
MAMHTEEIHFILTKQAQTIMSSQIRIRKNVNNLSIDEKTKFVMLPCP